MNDIVLVTLSIFNILMLSSLIYVMVKDIIKMKKYIDEPLDSK